MRYLKLFFFAIAFLAILNVSGSHAGQQKTSTKKLIVGTKIAPPFAIKNMDGSWTGISIELWREVAKELHLTYEFREFDLKGLVNGVEKRSLDLAVAALTITPERELRFDFTHPFYTTGLGIAVKSKSKNPWRTVWKRFLSLSFLKVVAALSLLLLTVGFLVWWFEHKKNTADFGGAASKGIGSGFWWSAVTMTTVGYGDKAPRTIGGRLVALVWMFASIIVISSFTAAITSSLTVTKLESTVKRPEDLRLVRVGTVANSTSENYLGSRRITFQPFNTVADGIRALNSGLVDALVYDAPIMRYLINSEYHGILEVLPIRVQRQDYGIALPEGSALREPINRVMLRKISEPEWQDMLIKYLGE